MAIDWDKYKGTKLDPENAERFDEAINDGESRTMDMAIIARFSSQLGSIFVGKDKKDELFEQFEDKKDAYRFSKALANSPAMEGIGKYLKAELNGDTDKIVAASTPQIEGLVTLYENDTLPDFLAKLETDPTYKTEFALATKNGEAASFIADYKKPTAQQELTAEKSPAQDTTTQNLDSGVSFLDAVAGMYPSTGPESKYGDNIQKLIDAAPVMSQISIEQNLDELQSKGELAAFEQKLVNNPDYQTELNQAATGGYTNQLNTLINTHESVALSSSNSQYKENTKIPEQKEPIEKESTLKKPAQNEASDSIMKFIDEHVAKNPNDAALGLHFQQGVITDPKLKAALTKFQKNNADMLKGGGEDDMVSGMLDKDAMVHDLLASYKDTPEKAYAALADDNFQMQAFLQYSPVGQAAGFILEPLMQMLGGLMGQGSNLASWANADFGDMMKDFQNFFSNEMGNVMGMGNSDLGLFERLGTVVNAVVYAAQDAADVTRYDREYMPEHNSDADEAKITYVGENNAIEVRTYKLGGTPPVTQEAPASNKANKQDEQTISNTDKVASPKTPEGLAGG